MRVGVVLSSTGFSLWVLDLARTNPRRLNPAPLKSSLVSSLEKIREPDNNGS
jgi:hypothetical protein